MTDARTARKFAAIAARITRGSTPGERTAARNVGGNLIRRKGLRACLPSHPSNRIDGFAHELVEVARAMHGRKSDEVERFAFYADLPSFGAKEVGRALAQIRSAQRAGWTNGVWTGEGDLRFLNVAEWGFQRAFYAAAEVDGFTREEANAFVASRTHGTRSGMFTREEREALAS